MTLICARQGVELLGLELEEARAHLFAFRVGINLELKNVMIKVNCLPLSLS